MNETIDQARSHTQSSEESVTQLSQFSFLSLWFSVPSLFPLWYRKPETKHEILKRKRLNVECVPVSGRLFESICVLTLDGFKKIVIMNITSAGKLNYHILFSNLNNCSIYYT